MFKKGSIVIRVIVLLLVLAVLAGGGVALYRFGYMQGVAQSPAIAAAWAGAAKNLPEGQKDGKVMPFGRGQGNFPGQNFGRGDDFGRGYGYMPMMGRGRGGFHFPFGGLIGLLFAGLLFFGLLRFVFRPPWMHRGYWHHNTPPGWGPPPWAQQPPVPQGSAPTSEPPAPPAENA